MSTLLTMLVGGRIGSLRQA